jgi:hypothetical protein
MEVHPLAIMILELIQSIGLQALAPRGAIVALPDDTHPRETLSHSIPSADWE